MSGAHRCGEWLPSVQLGGDHSRTDRLAGIIDGGRLRGNPFCRCGWPAATTSARLRIPAAGGRCVWATVDVRRLVVPSVLGGSPATQSC